jgi:acyl dehydratase
MTAEMAPAYRYEDLREGAGLDLGSSRWVTVDQDRIDKFAQVSEDHQWIHVDAERAAHGAFGNTIAHGYLTITLVGTLFGELLNVDPSLVMVNYGLDKLRFTAPVPADSRLRASAVISTVEETPRGLRINLDVTGEVDGAGKPACRAKAVVLVSRS